MTRVLVTGGAGFLGSTVAALLAQHSEVSLVVAADVRRNEQLPESVLQVNCDVTDAESISRTIAEYQINTVVHLAAIVNPGGDVALEYRVDVTGTEHVLQACAAHGVQRIVVSSSGAAYGYHADSPAWIDESTPLRGNDEFPYSRHKRIVEELLASYRATHPELEQTILRIGTILGPTVRNQITALWDGTRVLRIAGSESPFVFIWVDDVAEVMVRAATGAVSGVFNVAGDGALSVSEIADLLGKPLLTLPAWLLSAVLRVGRLLRVTPYGPEQVRFLRYRPVLDNKKLKSEFGYLPTRSSRAAFEEYLSTHPGVRRS